MAVAFDAAAGNFTAGSPSSPVTLAHTCGASATVLVVFVDMAEAGNITGVTYNGDAMTQLGSTTNANARDFSTWYLLSPDTGSAYNVSVSFTGTPANIFISAGSFTGAGTPENRATASGTSTAPSVAVTSESGALVFDGCLNTGNENPTAGAGQTERYSAPTFDGWVGSTEAGDTSVTMSWSLPGVAQWNIQGVSIPEGGGTAHTLVATDTLSLSDVSARVWNATQTTTETVTLTDTATPVSTFSQSFIESITLTDTATADILVILSFTEEITLADGTVTPVTTFAVTATEQVNLSETWVVPEGVVVIETISLSDLATAELRLGVVLQETLGLTDVVVISKSGWNYRTKHGATWTNRSKNTTTWTFRDKA